MDGFETTGDAITRALISNGVDTVFGVPGVHIYDLNDAFARSEDQLRFIHTRHEQGAAYMAFGYAQSTGRLGVFSVVPGPGVLNAGAALCTALGANSPVLCLTGNIKADLIGRGRGQLHELPDQLATLRGIVKTAERINSPTETAAVFSSVVSTMRSGRPGPGAIEAPWDVFGQSGPVVAALKAEPLPAPPVDSRAIEDAAALIKAAKRPLILVGGGAADASDQVARLAEKIGAPVTAHRSGKGVLPADHANWLDLVAAYEYWKDVDLLIGIGSRLELAFMRWTWQPPGLKIVRLDIDPTEFVRLKPDVGVLGDAQDSVASLTEAVDEVPAEDRIAEFAQLRTDARARFAVTQPQVDYLDAIRDVLPRDGFFVEEISQMGFTARFAFPVYGPRQYVTCGYQDNLGFGFNTALGVKVAHPDRAVVSITGDGGFMYGAQELSTAVRHGINVVVIVFNNSGFGNVQRDQRQTYEGRYIGSDLANPDFVDFARSFGVYSRRVASPDELRVELAAALAADQPALIEVVVPPESEANPWPFLHTAPHDN